MRQGVLKIGHALTSSTPGCAGASLSLRRRRKRKNAVAKAAVAATTVVVSGILSLASARVLAGARQMPLARKMLGTDASTLAALVCTSAPPSRYADVTSSFLK
jgi:hypothetical protein